MDGGTYDRRVERDNKVWQLIDNIPTVLFVNRTYVGLEIIILKHVDYLLR